MHTPRAESAAAIRRSHHPLVLPANEPETPWEAKAFTDLVPPATLAEARARRDELARLLGHERAAAADFLLALADFDRRRGWEQLGHASLFAFLCRELKLSNGAAWSRSSAARLLPRFPAVEAALRDGQLCLSSVGELARVLTPENQAAVLPRFFGRSFREAKELVAAMLPDPRPPRREVVTMVGPPPQASPSAAPLSLLDLARPATPSTADVTSTGAEAAPADGSVATRPHGSAAGLTRALTTAQLRAPEAGNTRPARDHDDGVEPLTADLRRLHLTVSARFLEKVARARDALSHAMPRAGTEQVLEEALDLLLEVQARRKAIVKRPRTSSSQSKPNTVAANPERSAEGAKSREPAKPPAASIPADSRGSAIIPAAIEREVRLRDGDRCQFPLDGGGTCDSTWQIELDHLTPRALGGPTTVENLRCACFRHNQRAAELALGAVVMAASRRRRR